MLYFGGRNEDVRWAPPDLASWLGLGWAVCTFAYRGRGGSTGQPGDGGCLADALAQVQWLQAQGQPIRLVLVGRSIGAALAVQAAHALPPGSIERLVLLSPPMGIGELVRRHPLLAPASPLLKIRLDAYRVAGDVTADVLVLLAEGDRRVPKAHSEALAARLAGQTIVEVVPGTNHKSLPRAAATLARIRHHLCPSEAPAPH